MNRDQALEAMSGKCNLRELIREIVMAAYHRNGRNYNQTARSLGLPKSTVHDWIKKWQSTEVSDVR